ncbi:MAG TPA: hypothetical protein PLS49_02595 [Candidatus Woesebacteria bacterium]|nr:hypothetical protein [Candidatus Woesebacteria bacterium]
MPNRHHVRHVDNIPSISTLHIWEKVVPASGYEIYNSQTHREYILFISHKPYRFLLEIKRVFHNRRGLHEEQLYQIPHWLLEQGVEEEDINLMYPFPSNFNIFRAFWNQLTDSSPPYFSNHIIIWGGEKK